MTESSNKLRTPENITALDPRNQPAWPLEKSHASLQTLRLNSEVPARVTETFETAKNLSLYACFVNDFHATACLTAFVALEIAIKEK